jgi:hypothetical protein
LRSPTNHKTLWLAWRFQHFTILAQPRIGMDTPSFIWSVHGGGKISGCAAGQEPEHEAAGNQVDLEFDDYSWKLNDAS